MTNAEPVAWVLNLDAEDELSHPGAHTPTAVMKARVEALLPKLEGLILPGDQLIWPGDQSVDPSLIGRAWCPTRWALSQMERAGVRLPRAPGMEVLRRVNHRRFCHELGQTLPGAGYAENTAQVAALLVGECLLKRPLGYAGRGRRKIRAGEVSAGDQAWIDASLRDGDGLQVEPFVQREVDCGLHGWLDEDGSCIWGRATKQVVDVNGAWVSTRVAASLAAQELEALHGEARRTASALHSAGYFGPFGVDAFRWVDSAGRLQFQPRCEINARYSMGWAVGMGGFRPSR
jgi:hypothetical protein